MRRKKHKRSANTVLLVTSNAPEAKLKQLHIKPWVVYSVLAVISVAIGFVIGYFIYEEKIWEAALHANQDKVDQIEALKAENSALQQKMNSSAADYEAKISSLEDEIKLLSNSLNSTIKNEEELSKQIEKQQTPTVFPLSGLASMEESEEDGNPICIFTGAEGNNILATASGTVESIGEDPNYGAVVCIDHGNGYKTIYKNKGELQVKNGDSVIQGAVLFAVTKDNLQLGYQVMLNDVYINPTEILAING